MVELDAFERRIVRELQANARLSNQELAERVGLSPSACWRRVKRLETEGVFTRFSAQVDRHKLGLHEVVFAHVSLHRHTKGATEEFMDKVLRREEVQECYALTGENDYLLRVVVSDVRAYHAFLEEVLFVLPHISKVNSNFALQEIKYDTAVPLPER